MSSDKPIQSDTIESNQGNTGNSDGSASGVSWKMAISAGFMALFIGGMAAWATAEIGLSLFAFLIAAVGSGYYLYQKPIPSAAIGTGLYVVAILMAITPISFYLPTVLAGSDGTASGAGAFIGGILGLVIWGFVFLILAIVTFVIGYFINRRANKKLSPSE